jgi:RNA polymerase sigma-70 factor, ECF subfamily
MNIEKIWQDHYRQLRMYIYRQVKDETLTEDLLHDVYVRVREKIKSVEDARKISSWLYRVTSNVVIDYFRKNPDDKFIQYQDDLPQKSETNLSDEARRELSKCLIPMINELPEDYQKAIYLSEIEDQPQKKVTEIMGLSVSGAKSKIQRGRKKIKAMLTDCCEIELDPKNRISSFDCAKDSDKLC